MNHLLEHIPDMPELARDYVAAQSDDYRRGLHDALHGHFALNIDEYEVNADTSV